MLTRSNRKLNAAIRSMPQFIPVVRGVFLTRVEDDLVEAATSFLYIRAAEDTFGRRFSDRMRESLREHYQYADPDWIDERRKRIEQHQAEFFEDELEAAGRPRDGQERFTAFVQSVIRALLTEGALDAGPEMVRETFDGFERAARRIAEHLHGIKRQHSYVMK